VIGYNNCLENVLLHAQKYANDAKTTARNIYFIAVWDTLQ